MKPENAQACVANTEDSFENEFLEDPLFGPKCVEIEGKDMFHEDQVVCHAESPSEFYVRHLNADSRIKKLEKNIKTFYETRNPPLAEQIVINGYYICRLPMLYEKKWARMLVKELDNIGRQAVVFLIDHGIKISIKFDKVYPMRKSFARMPCAAIPATLSVAQDKEWTEQEVEIFIHDIVGTPVTLWVLEHLRMGSVPYETLKVLLIIPGHEKQKKQKDEIYSFRSRYKAVQFH